jgi:hypothetical protein
MDNFSQFKPGNNVGVLDGQIEGYFECFVRHLTLN